MCQVVHGNREIRVSRHGAAHERRLAGARGHEQRLEAQRTQGEARLQRLAGGEIAPRGHLEPTIRKSEGSLQVAVPQSCYAAS